MSTKHDTGEERAAVKRALDALHLGANDIYERVDEGEISYEQARAEASRLCLAFLGAVSWARSSGPPPNSE